MKVNIKIYAYALYESLKQAKTSDFDLLISNFIKLLVQKNILSLADKIFIEFEKIYNEKEGVIDVKVSSAFALTALEKEKVLMVCQKVTGKKINLDEKIDLSLIGGLKLQFGDIVIDDSILARSSNLKNSLLNN